SSGYNGTAGGNIFLAAVSPFAKTAFNFTNDTSHYNLLSTVEWLLGVGATGHHDGTAGFPAMRELFRFAGSYPVSGTVSDRLSGQPLAGAWVNVTGAAPQLTNASGTFALSLLNGSYNLSVSAPGYASYSAPVRVAGAPVVVNVSLARLVVPTYALTGTVSARTTGAPVAGAVVGLDPGTETRTAADGTFGWNVSNGSYRVTVSAGGFEAAATSVTIMGEPGWANFSLTKIPPGTYPVSGAVVAVATGDPVGGASVSSGTGVTNTTDAQGHYVLWLPNGTYNLTATAVGFESGGATVTVGGSPGSVDFALIRSGDGPGGPSGSGRSSVPWWETPVGIIAVGAAVLGVAAISVALWRWRR
ncbi:MAG TPA: carboxypeptidase regulatory-like domain-containing protein, partial [Thermoplasmata archaeon]|nr:carboxypeptidase regulatory-like domain-containing protein [Thermoplasmata archaeon]